MHLKNIAHSLSELLQRPDNTPFITGWGDGCGAAARSRWSGEWLRTLAAEGATIAVCDLNDSGTPDWGGLSAVVDEINKGGGRAIGLTGSVSDTDDVASIVEGAISKFGQVDILVNNAGAIFTSHETTADGFERTWALNHLNYFLLTTLLKDVLMASSPARVINVASDAHKPGKMLWDVKKMLAGSQPGIL